ncbi:cytoplasmic protein [Fusobacterium nucleatum subsp. nucleatum]|uniref:Cytoplasmic protein n=2 Tax=Fusobacterium nucleatum subsp. nucleatum TaxID=76856 RepID=A0A117MWU2_FUSNC|nr:toxin-antitoxin system YwqK family antitoxin [Fusobacterium nucleatum]ALF23695.1 cytoplasmic protein [Fusobacterium nucleatum subsp. nucleatum ChDC F316]KUL99777.1 cytoplasmic protein [Fusobacterium nucleatum subsp. nucleatum]WMS29571.1 toxin-antitoxin system YwqK family antitoxin [Fusobacterium nucleatum]
MKKVLSALLLIIAMVLSACGGVKYEYKDGVMYGDGKEATGTFEFKAGKYKVKANFVDGLVDGLLEKYYPDGSIMVKDTYVNGENTKEEIYYKNGQLMGTFSDDEDLKFYYDDGKLIMTYNDKTGETLIYHENGNPLMTTNNKETAIYNENNEMLFKVENNKLVDIGATLKNLENGSFEFVKDNKVIAKIDANGEIINYLYSTGETMLKVNEATGITEFFFKNGNTFMKQEGNKSVVNYKDGKTLYELEGDVWKFYNQEGEEIISNFELITDIKKVD